jgi:hypothetical protein
MSYGDLAAVSSENIEPMDADNGNTHNGHYSQYPVTTKEGAGEKTDEKDKYYPPIQPGVKDSHILRVAFLKSSCA